MKCVLQSLPDNYNEVWDTINDEPWFSGKPVPNYLTMTVTCYILVGKPTVIKKMERFQYTIFKNVLLSLEMIIIYKYIC